MFTNIHDRLQIFTNVYKLLQMFTNILKCLRMFTHVHYAEENTLFFMQGPKGGPRFFYFDATHVFLKFQDYSRS